MNFKIALLVLLFTFFGGLTSCSAPSNPTLSAYQTAVRQTALVESPTGWGTAVMVKRLNDEGAVRWFAFTAEHVVKDAPVVKLHIVLWNNGVRVGRTVFTARVLAKDDHVDVALLSVACTDDAFSPADFASEAVLPPGEPIYAVGNFLGDICPGSLSIGIISAIGANIPRWKTVDQSSATAFPGASGGPTFNSKGQVVGIVVGSNNTTLNFFVPVRSLCDWARENGLLWAIRGIYCPTDKTVKTLRPLPGQTPDTLKKPEPAVNPTPSAPKKKPPVLKSPRRS